MAQAVTRILSKKKVHLDFGTFRLYRIEVLEDLVNAKKFVKIFYKLNDRHDRSEKTITSETIYTDAADDYAKIAKDYYLRYTSASSISYYRVATPRGLMTALLD